MVEKDYLVDKIDRRYKGYPQFTHRLDFKVQRGIVSDNYQRNVLSFYRARELLHSLLGAGVEVDYVGVISAHLSAPQWAWDTSHYNLHIFLKEKEFLMFQLAFN